MFIDFDFGQGTSVQKWNGSKLNIGRDNQPSSYSAQANALLRPFQWACCLLDGIDMLKMATYHFRHANTLNQSHANYSVKVRDIHNVHDRMARLTNGSSSR
ncbi:hypothetical protein OH492_08400 [Vibrio chagasii]|nr:hypothetical protein [Vibrio chagasii]